MTPPPPSGPSQGADVATKPTPTIGIVTALSKEYVAVEHLLDNHRPWVQSRPGCRYLVGSLPAYGGGEHQVALCEVGMGNNKAATRAALLKNEFPSVEHIIMVGIAGGVPHPTKVDQHVRLGDIVVSSEVGVVQFDNVRETEQGIEHRHPARAPGPRLLEADAALQQAELRGEFPWEPFLSRMQRDRELWCRPPNGADVLYKPGWFSRLFRRSIEHPADDSRRDGLPRVFRGPIGASNTLLKRASRRDYLRDRLGLRAVEMESSGIADAAWELEVGYFVVRGICDYCDWAKSDAWQHYAAAVSAAYCRALLEQLPPTQPERVVTSESLTASVLVGEADRRARHLALGKQLLNISAPTPLAKFFHDPSARALAASAQVASLTPTVSKDSSQPSHTVASLFDRPSGAVSLVAGSGYGKSFAVWKEATRVVEQGRVIPIFLSVRDMASSSDAVALLSRLGGVTFEELRTSPEVVFVLDGWSEFPREVSSQATEFEQRSLLALLGERPIVATSRTRADARFEYRDMLPLPRDAVRTIVAGLDPTQPVTDAVLDVLQQPLALLLFVFLQVEGEVSLGRLLQALHTHVSQRTRDPATLLTALAAVATELVAQRHGLTRAAFDEAVARIGTRHELPNLRSDIEQLGTLLVFSDRVVPFHDSYIEWLAGVGALRASNHRDACEELRLRAGIALALESGERPSRDFVHTATQLDFRLAAQAAEHLPPVAHSDIKEQVSLEITAALQDKLAIRRHRGIQAAAYSNAIPLADVLRAAVSLKDEARWLEIRFSGERLWASRNDLSEHLSDARLRWYAFEAIAERADPRWIPWLKDIAERGLVPQGEVLGLVLACTPTLPPWVADKLGPVLKEQGWHLRPATKKARNRALAAWVAEHYDEFNSDKHSNWLDMNALLHACGDEDLYASLLTRFATLTSSSQEHLGYLIVELGDPWTARFQELAFKGGSGSRHDRLVNTVSKDVPVPVAAEWVSSPDHRVKELGWRTLAAIRQNDVVPEVLRALPASFDDVDRCPALAAIPELVAPPASLVEELWSRMRGTLRPQITERLFAALAAIRPVGLASIVRHMTAGVPLPYYFRKRFLQLLRDWEREHKLVIVARTPWGEMTFGESVMMQALREAPNDHFVKEMFRSYRPTAIAASIVAKVVAGDATANEFLKRTGRVGRFEPVLLDWLVSTAGESGLDMAMTLFEDSFDSFPESRLMQLLTAMEASTKPHPRIRRFMKTVSTKPSSAHRRFYVRLIGVVVRGLEEVDLESISTAAQLTGSLPPEDVVALQRELPPLPDPRTVTFAYRSEEVLGRVLVTEQTQWVTH